MAYYVAIFFSKIFCLLPQGASMAIGKFLGELFWLVVPKRRKEMAKRMIIDMCRRHKVTAISIGNGTASRESEQVVAELIKELQNPNLHYVITNEAGASVYSASKLATEEFPEFDVRVSILGHLQRGGTPSAHDRILASRTGVGAIEAIKQGQRNIMVGVRNNEVVYVPFSECIRTDKPFDKKLIKVLDELSI